MLLPLSKGTEMKLTAFLVLVFCVITSISGCAAIRHAKYEKTLIGFVGFSEPALISSWGLPTKTDELAGKKYLTYTYSRQVHFAAMAPSYNTRCNGSSCYSTPVGGSSASDVTFFCTTTFVLESGKVISWRWRGNDCRS